MKLSEFEMLLTEQVRNKFERPVNKADVFATLKALAPDVLARYGVRAVPEDAFFYELKDDVSGETAA